MAIEVRFDDVTTGWYRFKCPDTYNNRKWDVPPRIGDTMLDLNEFRYEVVGVTWYDPYLVRVSIQRKW